MQRLFRIGVTAAAMALIAATAQADPFMLSFSVQRTPAGGASWFSNAIGMDDGNSAVRTHLFLVDSFMTARGQRISFPNGAMTFTSGRPTSDGASASSSSWQTSGPAFPGMFFGSAARPSTGFSGHDSDGSHGSDNASTNNPGFGVNVPGAGAWYNPFNPDLGDPGNTNASQRATGLLTGGTGASSLAASGARASQLAFGPNAVPATPEPSPLLLLATGLGVFLIWKKRDALKGISA